MPGSLVGVTTFRSKGRSRPPGEHSSWAPVSVASRPPTFCCAVTGTSSCWLPQRPHGPEGFPQPHRPRPQRRAAAGTAAGARRTTPAPLRPRRGRRRRGAARCTPRVSPAPPGAGPGRDARGAERRSRWRGRSPWCGAARPRRRRLRCHGPPSQTATRTGSTSLWVPTARVPLSEPRYSAIPTAICRIGRRFTAGSS